jgi:hypothetical protein
MNYDIVNKFNNDILNVVLEQNIDDAVFCTATYPPFMDQHIEADIDYKNPDRTQHVFSSMTNDVYVMYPTGYCSEVRKKSNLTCRGPLTNFICRNNNVRGIYIVESFLFHRTELANKDFSRSIMERFMSLNFNTDYKTKESFETVINSVCRFGKGNFQPAKVKFRIISFIPENVIYEGRRIYHPNSGLMFGFGVINNRVMHPCNQQYIEAIKPLKCDTQNFIEIEIVDNNSAKEYWTRIGNKVIKLEPTRNLDREEGCYINLHVNDVNVATYTSSLEDMSEQAIYYTKQDAEADGNLEAKLKILELENKATALNNEKIKLDQELIRLNNENEKLQIEKAKLLIERYKIQVDATLTKEKYNFELRKILLEIRHIKDKLTLFKYTAIIELVKKKMDFDYNIRMKENKDNDNYSTLEQVSQVQSIFGNMLKTTKLITEVF